MEGRRWDIDERGHGVASGEELLPNVEELAAEMRADAFSFLGRIAEHTTHIRQQTFEDRVEYEMATGTLGGETPFAPHGRLVRLRIRPA